MQEDFEFMVIIEVDDVEALKSYLSHPSHAAFGRHFTQSAAAALAYDYELVEAERRSRWSEEREDDSAVSSQPSAVSGQRSAQNSP